MNVFDLIFERNIEVIHDSFVVPLGFPLTPTQRQTLSELGYQQGLPFSALQNENENYLTPDLFCRSVQSLCDIKSSSVVFSKSPNLQTPTLSFSYFCHKEAQISIFVSIVNENVRHDSM